MSSLTLDFRLLHLAWFWRVESSSRAAPTQPMTQQLNYQRRSYGVSTTPHHAHHSHHSHRSHHITHITHIPHHSHLTHHISFLSHITSHIASHISHPTSHTISHITSHITSPITSHVTISKRISNHLSHHISPHLTTSLTSLTSHTSHLTCHITSRCIAGAQNAVFFHFKMRLQSPKRNLGERAGARIVLDVSCVATRLSNMNVVAPIAFCIP